MKNNFVLQVSYLEKIYIMIDIKNNRNILLDFSKKWFFVS
jgi:hypothetical protein